MANPNLQAAAAAAATKAPLSTNPPPTATAPRPTRIPSSGSFHAGAPFPSFAPYENPATSSSSASRPRLASAGVLSSLGASLRRQSTHKYHTFPTQPPRTPAVEQPQGGRDSITSGFFRYGSPPRGGVNNNLARGKQSQSQQQRSRSGSRSSGGRDGNEATPLPWRQLCLLAALSLAEQTALNSIGPYLPTMIQSFGIPPAQVGVYVGSLASAFALAQLATNLAWGYLSDRIGRKLVMLMGTTLLAVCFCFFGFCRSFGQVVAVHVAMGLLNGNAAVVPTCLGELTDRSNQSKAFGWLPVMYSLGSITGPALGGLLVGKTLDDGSGELGKYPFLAPNVMSAAVLFLSVVVLAFWFEETMENMSERNGLRTMGKDFVGWCDRWASRVRRGVMFVLHGGRSRTGHHGHHRHYGVGEGEHDASDGRVGDEADENQALLGPQRGKDGAVDRQDGKNPENDDETDDASLTSAQKKSAFRELANRTTLIILITYLVFQLSNISFNSLYPIFASAPPPTGRALEPGTIGLSLSFAGLVTILFQVFLFTSLKARIGNLGLYRWSLLGMAVAMAFMPWVGYIDDEKPWLGLGSGKGWLYAELGVVLVAKNICAVGGLSSVMLLVSPHAYFLSLLRAFC